MQLDCHLRQLVNDQFKNIGVWKFFSEDMEARLGRKVKVDRRKLKRIGAGDPTVTFTLGELEVLFKYFVSLNMVQLHENFLFRPPGSLLDALHGDQALTIFYPSRFLAEDNTEGTSRWDVRAFEALLRTPEVGGLRVALQDVFHWGKAYTDVESLANKLATEEWYKALREEHAFISIASPFSCYASEKILCRMFELTPFVPYGLCKENPLPFYLYWPDADVASNSAFGVTREELEQTYPEQCAKLNLAERVVLIDGTLHPAPREGECMNLVIAQYWRRHLRLVLLGIHAPDTLAITRCTAAREITETLGPYRRNPLSKDDPNDVQPILINLIRTTITQQSREPGSPPEDMREMRDIAGTDLVSWQRWQVVDGQYENIGAGTYERPTEPNATEAESDGGSEIGADDK